MPKKRYDSSSPQARRGDDYHRRMLEEYQKHDPGAKDLRTVNEGKPDINELDLKYGDTIFSSGKTTDEKFATNPRFQESYTFTSSDVSYLSRNLTKYFVFGSDAYPEGRLFSPQQVLEGVWPTKTEGIWTFNFMRAVPLAIGADLIAKYMNEPR